MIAADHTLPVRAAIDDVWSYVSDIQLWAALFPGCRECIVVDDDNSRWLIKVGVGGLVKTVAVLVHVDRWHGPGLVEFSFQLESEPVAGSGSYSAGALAPGETQVTLQVEVAGSGHMAPMWEAMCRPLLPQLAKSFANSLKAEIEQAITGTPVTRPSILARLLAWFRRLRSGPARQSRPPDR